MVSVLFALLTALFNGLASVLQRMAAVTAPASKALHLSLLGYLVKHKVWLAGIAMVVVAAVCQAIALATGPVALVQPIFIIELPFTLLLSSRIFHRKLPRLTWGAVALVTLSLGVGLAAASLSAMAQGWGYLLAALGPLAVGLLHASTGGWDVPVTLLLVLCAVELGAGWLAARGRVLPPPGPQSATG